MKYEQIEQRIKDSTTEQLYKATDTVYELLKQPSIHYDTLKVYKLSKLCETLEKERCDRIVSDITDMLSD